MPRQRRATGLAPRRFDTLLKRLVESDPDGWLRSLGFARATSVEVLNPTASTVLLEADVVLRIDAPSPWLLHLEFQSRRDRALPRRLLRYNVWLNGRHKLPVASVAVPLWPRVDGPELSGLLQLESADGQPYLSFAYQVIRPWELPVETLMAGAPLTLPLVALTGLPLRELPAVIGRLQERLSDAPREQAGLIWTSIDWLLGARLRPEVVAGLLAGVEEIMRESSTYQQVLAEGRAEGRTEGRAEGERRALLRVGERRLGPASPRVQAEVAALADLDRIERLTDRLFDVTSWDELLATP